MEKIAKISTIFIMAFIVIIIFLQVFCRYVLNFSFSWTEEIARYMISYLAFLAASSALLDGKHVSFNFVINKIPIKYRSFLTVLKNILIMYFLIIIIREGFNWAITSGLRMRAPGTGILMIIAYLGVPLGCTAILIQTIYVTIFNNKEQKNNSPR